MTTTGDGAARIRLILLPGMDGTAHLLRPLLEALPGWLEPVVVTYPMHGPNGYADLLPLVLDAVRRGPAVVLGWSFSGPLALAAAAREPALVRGVILAATFVQPPQPWMPRFGWALFTPVVGTIRFLRRLPIWLLRRPSDPLRADKAKVWRDVSARVLAARARAISRVDARADLAACRAPLLYLAAERDAVVPPHNLAAIAALRPDLAVATLPGSHFALHSQAVLGARAIAEFAERCIAPAPRG